VVVSNVSRLCHSKPVVTVNGRFPGPTIYAREGDRLIVNVTNYAHGGSYTYHFNVTGQRGTLWWHAHILWLRATVHGAIVIMPGQGVPYPFPQPYQETELILGESWRTDAER
ncbi:hypothetical protein BHE74_00006301, partial [Ensete ventricosum]